MKVISREKVSYQFDPRTPSVEQAEIGESVIFQTRDCFNDELRSKNDLATSIDMSHMNPCTGPLCVKGAAPGDILAVRIEDIRLRDWGVLTLIPNEGVLDKYVKSPLTKIVAIDQEKGYVDYGRNIKVALRPHVGTMATTPNIIFPTGRTGIHGGNMDINRLGPGSVIYFPVFVEGAMLSMGDVHANMGDAEICIGVETGADVQVRIENVYKGAYLSSPIIETKDHWITYSDSPYGKDGVLDVCMRMAEFLCSRTRISMEDATLLISITGDVHIAQWAEAGYNYTFYLEFPKDVFTDGSLHSFSLAG
ncbi:MAG: acetamidase/formamidase family protein [Thermovirga sp.]